jgi:hypothetical protein
VTLGGVLAYDVSDKQIPVLISGFDSYGEAKSLYSFEDTGNDHYLAVAWGERGLLILQERDYPIGREIYVESTKMNLGSSQNQNITSATLSKSDVLPLGSPIKYEITNRPGAQYWHELDFNGTNSATHFFNEDGNHLRWRAAFETNDGGTTPYILWVELDYSYE